MRPEPQVSVVMGVYNAERFLRAAIESILDQTFAHFELILVEDGSTDASPQILATYSDPRVRVLRNPVNRGHPASLNRGLAAARAPLVARMDADDLAEPRRLERQVAAMHARPELDVLGTWTTEIDEEGQERGGFSFPASEAMIRWAMTVTNVVYHPTVIMRRERLEAIGGYDESVECADDYDLFTRMLISGGRIDLLPEPLLRYRRTAGQISHARVEQQQQEAMRVRQRYLGWLVGEEPSPELATAVGKLQVPWGEPPQVAGIEEALHLVRRIRRRCLEGVSDVESWQVNQRIRQALLYHAGRLREERRMSEARRVWWEALRCGRDAWRRRAVWGAAARLAWASRVWPSSPDGEIPASATEGSRAGVEGQAVSAGSDRG